MTRTRGSTVWDGVGIFYSMLRFGWLLALCFWLGSAVFGQDRARVELPYKQGTVVIEADRISVETAQTWVAEGNVVVTYQDILLKSEKLIYEQQNERVIADTEVVITKGVQWLKGSSGVFNLTDNTARLNDANGFTDEELFVRAKVLLKTGPDTFRSQSGLVTACEEAVPKWSFRIHRATIKVGGRASLLHTFLQVKKVPVFYIPYLTFPTAKKERSSGFLIPSTGNSNNKGRRISQSFYLVLGRSADVLIQEDYFSKRGFGHGFTFRARPNADSFFRLDGYTIDDRRDQGGASLSGVGQTRFGSGFRLVADFNLVSNFIFRRVFADSFYVATRPNEESRVFVTNNFGNRSFNFRLGRDETVFRGRNAITRHIPSFDFRISGQALPRTPFYFDLDVAAGGVSRSDREIETPSLTQRMDLHPRIYLSLPLFQGLRVTPRLGVRHTFYSERLEIDSAGNRRVVSDNLNRRYLDFRLDLKGWGLSKIYRRAGGSAFKHLIEPELRYRYTTGIDDFREIIRFDEEDAIADSNEVEYALVNRFFVRRATRDGKTTHEWLSVRVAQKYFFDPDFGGALRPGFVNQFFPLYTLTGFPYGGIRRNFSPLTTVARFSPSRRLNFDIRGDYDLEFNRFRNFSVTGFLYKQKFNLATTYFWTRDLEPGTFENNQLQGVLRWGNTNRGFSVSTIFTYDARTRDLLNLRSRVNYNWDCCGVSVELQRINVGLRQERQTRFSFYLKGIGAFGTIRRPDQIF